MDRVDVEFQVPIGPFADRLGEQLSNFLRDEAGMSLIARQVEGIVMRKRYTISIFAGNGMACSVSPK